MTVNFTESIVQDHHKDHYKAPEHGSLCQAEEVQTTAGLDSRKILLAAQLGCLASQHHRSEYNCQKYGSKGSSLNYVPLSLQLPEHFQQLLAKQALYVNREAWWPCQKTPPRCPNKGVSSEGPTLVRMSRDPLTLQEDLCNAISSPLTPQTQENPFVTEPIPPIKTSQSHPLNISVMIPWELALTITTHLIPAVRPSPVMFEIPLPYQLHRITTIPPYFIHLPIPSTATLPPPHHSKLPNSATTGFVNILWNQKLMRRPFSISSNTLTRVSVSSHGELGKKSARSSTASLLSSPRHLSSSDHSARSLNENEKLGQHFVSSRTMPSSPGIIRRPTTHGPKDATPRSSSMMETQGVSAFTSFTPRRLGNLFLSSCPGKKVRLSGPVNGRSGVCRDLTQDLRRIKDLGVGCVVCCLDDEELSFLGAPWEEYARTADELGLDVLRIPTPEGLAPPDPAILDGYLTRLIRAYTLRGIPILVHCRGGVGRAGLVACCWALKLGLCGWIETQPNRSSRLSFTAPENLSELPPLDENGGVRRDTFQLVERVITLVRRRRSYKAVETFEQVKFLVDYVDFLREKSKIVVETTVDSALNRDIRLH